MADTAFLKGNPLRWNKPSPPIQKGSGRLWPFSHVVMLLAVLCLAVAYEEIVATELIPCSSQTAQSHPHACRDAEF